MTEWNVTGPGDADAQVNDERMTNEEGRDLIEIGGYPFTIS